MTKPAQNVALAAYARFSTEKQKETSTIDQIREINRVTTDLFGRMLRADEIIKDEALSGEGADRPGYGQLMSLVRARPRRIDVVLVHDVSRLGRNASEALNAFELLKFAGIRLICVADGIDTDDGAAEALFQFKAIYAQQFTQMVREQTLRGMKGRAEDGYSTGGLPYGYRSHAINDSKGEPLYYVVTIDPEEAGVVIRIFTMFRDGHSVSSIARALNEDGVPTPRKGYKYRSKQWMDTTVRAMLRNARYIGRITFGKRQWMKEPGTNKRRPIERDEPLVAVEHAEQRIVPQDLWSAVQARNEAIRNKYTRNDDGSPKGRSMPGNLTHYPLSGLLTCAVCGGPMVIIGGGPRRRYGCSHAKQRGTCDNRLTVLEEITRDRIIETLRERYTHPIAVAYVRRRLAEQLREGFRSHHREIEDRRARLRRTEAKIRGLVEFIADGNRSEAVVQGIADLEAQARDERRLLGEMEEQLRAPVRLPSDDEIKSRFLDLEALVAREPMRARELLRRLFKDGSLHLHPEADGVYIARGAIFWLGLALAVPETTKPSADFSGRASGPIDGRSCGGRI